MWPRYFDRRGDRHAAIYAGVIFMNIIGLDIGGTKCAVIAGTADDGELSVKEKQVFATDTTIPAERMLKQFYPAIERYIKEFGAECIGISCGGPLNTKTGTVLCPPNLPNFRNFKITEILQKKFNIPAFLQNDANACALAEWLYGAGRGSDNMIFMTFGTGLGAGLILDGRLYEGVGGNAGEIGHIRLSENGPVGFGKRGSFEGFCSGGGIAQLGYTLGLEAHQNGTTPLYFDPKTAPEGITAKSVAIAAEQHGDPTAIEVYRLCGEYLGKGLSILIDLFNPERIVIGSIFTRSRNGLWESCKEVIDREALPASAAECEVLPAMLSEQIGDFAALTVGVYGLKKQNAENKKA